MIRRVILVCLLFDFQSVDAWTLLEYPSRRPLLQHRGTALFGSTTDEETTSVSRRSVLKLVPTIVGLTTLTSPCVAAEVDPFAAMDDMLSSGAAGPGNSSNISSNSSSKPSSDASNKAPSNPSSDISAALKESKQRKNIAPRTHG